MSCGVGLVSSISIGDPSEVKVKVTPTSVNVNNLDSEPNYFRRVKRGGREVTTRSSDPTESERDDGRERNRRKGVLAMNLDFPVYHVLVIGFHHKKGSQVEFAFPPLEKELEKSAWKHLPTLSLPDGAHNFDHDTVYFHLPSLNNPHETVFGVACFQQICSDELKNRPEDVTRSTVQKSVVVLSKYPLYGHIQVKMSLITAAYFRERDFNQISIIEEAFHNLNACLTADLLNTPEAFVGLSPRDLIFLFRHQVVILFKLLLLEKKVLFRGASVGPLCSALLTLISLIPLTLEKGLKESACVKTSKALSIVPRFSREESIDNEAKNSSLTDENTHEKDQDEDNVDLRNQAKAKALLGDVDSVRTTKWYSSASSSPVGSDKGNLGSGFASYTVGTESLDLETIDKSEVVPDFVTAVQLSPSDAGLPLSLFNKGYLCHPYLSLHYMDLLTDTRVRGFVIGATNILFKQKKDLVDVVVEMQDGTIDIPDPNLRKLLTLTTPDLRFAENLVKQVTVQVGNGKRHEEDNFLDGVGWEGGDEWIRAQFKYYLMCLMRTSLTEEGERVRDDFGSAYLASWQNTNNWREWNNYINAEERHTPGIYVLCPGHPCEGNISVSDMKIRLNHTIYNTEGGRRLNQAVQSTGKAMAQTGRAVGGAFSSAKGLFSNWWSNVNTTGNSSEVTSSSSEGNNSSKLSTQPPGDVNKL